jgi:hypothetical protein
MRDFMKYDFPSNIYSDISQTKGKIIEKMIIFCNHPAPDEKRDEYRMHIGPSEDKNMWFSYIPRLFMMTLTDFGVLALRSRGRQHQSIGAAHFTNFPDRAEIEDEFHNNNERIMRIEADDPVYSRPYFASFIGHRIMKIEAIHGLKDGRPTSRRNERGFRITDDRGIQFLVGWGILSNDPAVGMCVIKPEEAKTDAAELTYKDI